MTGPTGGSVRDRAVRTALLAVTTATALGFCAAPASALPTDGLVGGVTQAASGVTSALAQPGSAPRNPAPQAPSAPAQSAAPSTPQAQAPAPAPAAPAARQTAPSAPASGGVARVTAPVAETVERVERATAPATGAVDRVARTTAPTVDRATAVVDRVVTPLIERTAPVVDSINRVTGAAAPALGATVRELTPTVDALVAPVIRTLQPVTAPIVHGLDPILGDSGPLAPVLGADGPLAPIFGGNGSLAPVLGDESPQAPLAGTKGPLASPPTPNGSTPALHGGNHSASAPETIGTLPALPLAASAPTAFKRERWLLDRSAGPALGFEQGAFSAVLQTISLRAGRQHPGAGQRRGRAHRRRGCSRASQRPCACPLRPGRRLWRRERCGRLLSRAHGRVAAAGRAAGAQGSSHPQGGAGIPAAGAVHRSARAPWLALPGLSSQGRAGGPAQIARR